jgi:hypothetical protein
MKKSDLYKKIIKVEVVSVPENAGKVEASANYLGNWR